MNVTAGYPVAMSSPTRAHVPRELDDAPRGKQARFDNHDDFYAFLESNRGPGGINPTQVHQPQISPQQQQPQQPRGMPMGQNSPQGPPDQSRPPVTNTFIPQRSASGRSRPPSYSGSRSEELLVDRSVDNSRKSNGDLHKAQRQNGRRGAGRPPTAGSGPSDNSPPRTGGSSPQRRVDSARPTSSDSQSPQTPGESIQRLKSPSVMSCVLQPLDKKVREYKGLMHQEQDEMARLDDEIRALQERRAQAEMRFLDAKSKHDDYHRQYSDVERAMRGEAPIQRELPPRPQAQQQRPTSVRDEDEEFEDEEYEPQPPVHRRMDSQQSFSRSSQKGSFGARFRNSLFGGR